MLMNSLGDKTDQYCLLQDANQGVGQGRDCSATESATATATESARQCKLYHSSATHIFALQHIAKIPEKVDFLKTFS